MIDLTTPEPPLIPPEPRQEHGHWGIYEVWVPDEPEWEPDDYLREDRYPEDDPREDR